MAGAAIQATTAQPLHTALRAPGSRSACGEAKVGKAWLHAASRVCSKPSRRCPWPTASPVPCWSLGKSVKSLLRKRETGMDSNQTLVLGHEEVYQNRVLDLLADSRQEVKIRRHPDYSNLACAMEAYYIQVKTPDDLKARVWRKRQAAKQQQPFRSGAIHGFRGTMPVQFARNWHPLLFERGLLGCIGWRYC